MENINIISIILEGVIVLHSLLIALIKKQAYGWYFAITFIIYVFYDLSRNLGWEISDLIMSFSFLIATISALIAVRLIYKKQ